MNVACLLSRTADAVPQRVAVREAGTSVTYAALATRAAGFRAALVAHGVAPGDRVAIALPNGAEAAAAFFGTLAAGAIATVVSSVARPRQLAHLLADSGARLLVSSDEDPLGGVDMEVIAPMTLHPGAVAARGDLAPHAVDDSAGAQLCYTSGSTGRPKGVLMTHANLDRGIRTVVEYLGIRREDRIASVLPFGFVYGLNQLTCAVATGATLEVIGSVLAPAIVRELVARECTVLAAVPPLWAQLLRASEFQRPIPALRTITCAGGRLSPDQVRALRAAQPQARLFLMYGLTEVFRSTFLSPEEVDAHPDSMGRAVAGSRVYVVREDGTLCADDEVGELVHAGPTVAQGYWGDPEATARVFRPNPFASGDPTLARAVFSGDLVRRDAEGRLYYVGRRDRIIKPFGIRASPDELTDALFASGLVGDAEATSHPDSDWGARLVAHVVLRPGATCEAVRRWCGLALPRHLQPVRVERWNELPRGPSGKHDLAALARGQPAQTHTGDERDPVHG